MCSNILFYVCVRKASTTGAAVKQSANASKDETSSEDESSDDEPSKAEAVKKVLHD